MMWSNASRISLRTAKKGTWPFAYKLAGSTGKLPGDGGLSILRTVEKGHGRIEKRTYYYSTSIG